MRNRINAVLRNACLDLIHRKAFLLFFLFTLLASVIVASAFHFQQAPGGILASVVYSLPSLNAFVGICACLIYGATSVEREVTSRTLSAVLTRPMSRWEYLLGRALAPIVLLGCYLGASFVIGSIGMIRLGDPRQWNLAMGLLQRFAHGAGLLLIIVPFAAVCSSGVALSCFIALFIVAGVAEKLPAQISPLFSIFKELFYYVSPTSSTIDFLDPRISAGRLRLEGPSVAATILENLLYGIVFFILFSAIYAKRDLTLRD